jgi:hypothetical protein
MDLPNKVVAKQDYGGKAMVVLSWESKVKRA